MWDKARYRTDPAYRLRILADVKKRHDEKKKDPKYRKLVYYRKQLYNLRRSIEIHLHKISLLERRIFSLLRKKEVLEREHKLSKATNNKATRRVS